MVSVTEYTVPSGERNSQVRMVAPSAWATNQVLPPGDSFSPVGSFVTTGGWAAAVVSGWVSGSVAMDSLWVISVTGSV